MQTQNNNLAMATLLRLPKCLKRFQVVGHLVVFLALIITLRAHGAQPVQITALSSSEIKKSLRFSNGYVVSVARNSAGTRLFIVYCVKTNSVWETMAATISATNLMVEKINGDAAVFDDNGSLVCTVRNHALIFQNGARIPLTAESHWGFVPGARLFYFGEVKKGISLFQSSAPNKPILTLESNFLAQSIFEFNGTILVLGKTCYPLDTKVEATRGFLISRSGNNFKIDKTIVVPKDGGALDMDPATGMLLLQTGSDLFSTWTLYNLKTKTIRPIGAAKEFGLFIDQTVCGIGKAITIP